MVSRGTTQQSSAPFNRRIVLDVIRRQGSVSRKEIVDTVSLSPQTVANITADLESMGLIASRRLKVKKLRGQPPIVFELNPSGGNSIGISLEPARLSAALVNLVGEVIRRQEAEVDAHDQRRTVAAMAAIVKDLVGRSTTAERLWGVGIALPGPLTGTEMSFVGPTALEGWSDLSALDQLHDESGLHVFYSVDSVAGALGESLFGVASSLHNFFYMHFGVGLGGTLVTNRSAYKGANGNATEIGHIPIVPGGKPCYCGNRGCLERYLSLHSLSEALGGADLRDHGKQLIARLFAERDDTLLKWCREAAAHLRNVLCVIENMLDPETVLIGGPAPRQLVEHIVAQAAPLHRSVRGGLAAATPRVLLSERSEDSSLLGAAVLPIYEMLSPRFELLVEEPRGQSRATGMLGQKPASRAGRL